MLTRINRIRNYRIFKDFAWPAGLQDFGRYNVIYGWNGAGKTTLSSLLRHLQRREAVTEGIVEYVFGDTRVLGSAADDPAIPAVRVSPPDLHSRRLFEERYVCVLREGHAAVAQGELTLDAFCALDHGMVSLQGGGFSGPTDEALAGIGRQRRVMVSVPSFGMLLDMVRSTDLVALVPERLLQDAQGLSLHRPPLEVPGFTKLLVWHARTHSDPRQRWVRERLVQACTRAPTQGATGRGVQRVGSVGCRAD